MIHETNTIRRDSLPAFAREYLTKDMLLFDIETTGLSPARDTVYCIGCGYAAGDEVRVELFFAECPEDEAAVLGSFFSLVRAHPDLITFNGTTFDLPFLRKRAAARTGTAREGTGPDRNADEKKNTKAGTLLPGAASHLDLYREARALRRLLELPSYKQKSIERFLGIDREDIYTGGELIEFYHRYVADPAPEILDPILLHNREDVIGMFDLLGILAYRQLRDGAFSILDMTEETEKDGRRFMNIRLRPDAPLPQSIRRTADGPDGISVLIGRETALVRLPVRHGILKHFFPDPENYYYLPDEDTVIHRSVGRFVDPSHRQRASGKNCFVRKECDYLVFPLCRNSGELPSGDGICLKKEYGDPDLCIEIPAKEEEMKGLLAAYFAEIMQTAEKRN